MNRNRTHNIELSNIFKKMSDCYKYLGNPERFRAIAYETASKTINNMSEPIDQYNHKLKELDELKGIGKSIAEKIVEYLDTGKIETYERLKEIVPTDLLELINNEGIGPATIRLLHDGLKIETRKQLVDKIKKGYLSNVKGIKKRKIGMISEALRINTGDNLRIPIMEANKIAEGLLNEIKKINGVEIASIAGSIRRRKSTIGDIDIVIAAPKRYHESIIDAFIHFSTIKRVLVKGKTKAIVLLDSQIQTDIRVVNQNEYAAALLYFTGSKEHNIILRSLAKKQRMKINEYGVFDINTGHKISTHSEEEIYKLLNLPFIKPENRFGKDEFKISAHLSD